MQELTVELLLSAYAIGMFPMAEAYEDPAIHWIEPRRRGIMPLDSFHAPRSLRKALRRRQIELRVDTAFEPVIRACATPTPDRPKTWLNEPLIQLYARLHRAGHAHSVEAWQGGELVGGLYGVHLGGAFFGESMFSRVTDASKMALVELVGRLRAGGFVLLDTQFLTSHLQRFGGVEISRAEYLGRLRRALPIVARFPLDPQPCWPSVAGGSGSANGSAHSITQTS